MFKWFWTIFSLRAPEPVGYGLGKCKQTSGLVNFVLESRLPLVQIGSIFRKTTGKAWNWYQRWLWRNGTWISVWNIPSGKSGLPFQMFRCSRKFSAGVTKNVGFYLLSNWIFRKLFANGKLPKAHKLAVFQGLARTSSVIPPSNNSQLLKFHSGSARSATIL